MVEPSWSLKVTQGEITSMSAKPRCASPAFSIGTSCALSPEKLRATKVAPSVSASMHRIDRALPVGLARLLLVPMSADAENWPLVRP